MPRDADRSSTSRNSPGRTFAGSLAAALLLLLTAACVPPAPPRQIAVLDPSRPLPPANSLTSSPSPAAAAPAQGIRLAPPLPRNQIVPAMPSPLMVWDPGHWSWEGAQYLWVPGRYVDRPSTATIWTPGHWSQDFLGYAWVPGAWS